MKKIIGIIFIFNLLALIFNPVINADQTVSATVPPHASDFQFNVTSDGQTTVPQNTALSYTITYGARQSAGLGTITTIVADYSADKASNNADVLDYVIGSASSAYNNTQPVVDLANHTIIWTIPNLPNGVTDQTVTFQLRTTSNYTNSDPVNFTVRTRMSNQYITLPDQTITQTYQFDQSLVTPTPTPTTLPTPTPTRVPAAITSQPGKLAPTSTPTPLVTTAIPTPTPESTEITSVSFPSVSDSQGGIAVTTSKPSRLTLFYGISPTSLTQTVTTTDYTRNAVISLSHLAADTTYYFVISATDTLGQTKTSEVFTFRTAKHSSLPNIQNDIVTFSSNNSVLSSGTQKTVENKSPAIILDTNSSYEITYTLADSIPIKSIDAVLINKVLATNTQMNSSEQGEIVIPMERETSTLYSANLLAVTQGNYEVDIRIVDDNGNIIEKKISDLKVMPRLTVFAQDTQQPLADARIYLSYYNSKTNSYQPITPALFGNISNPSYTNSLGQSPLILPQGKYRIEESALFYNTATVDFTIGLGSDQNFPQLYLKKDPLNITSLIIFSRNYIIDTWTKILIILHAIASSVRIFNLIAVVIMASSIIVTFFLFLLRTHLTVKHLPHFFFFYSAVLFKRSKQKYIFGSVLNEQKEPLSNVLIAIEDIKTETILTHIKTTTSGRFYLQNNFGTDIKLIFEKDGYIPETVLLPYLTKLPENGLRIVLEKGAPHHISAPALLNVAIKELGGMLFETGLVLSLIFECIFFFLYGIVPSVPFVILSFLNILLWIFYIHEQR